jgi:hypothetical protein
MPESSLFYDRFPYAGPRSSHLNYEVLIDAVGSLVSSDYAVRVTWTHVDPDTGTKTVTTTFREFDNWRDRDAYAEQVEKDHAQHHASGTDPDSPQPPVVERLSREKIEIYADWGTSTR